MKITTKAKALSLLLAAALLTSCTPIVTLPDNSETNPVESGDENGNATGGESGDNGETGKKDNPTGGVQLKNPLREKDNLDFTKEAGFAVNYLPTGDNDNLAVTDIFYIDGTGIAEIRMNSVDEAVYTYRISMLTDDDISGVYTDFDSSETLTVCGVEGVKLSVSDSSQLALWSYDDFSYSLYSEECTEEEFRDTLDNLILYTMVDRDEKKLLGILNTNYDGSRGPVPEPDKEYDFGGYGDGEDHGVIPYEFESIIVPEEGSYITVCKFDFKEDGTEYLTEIDSLSATKDFFCVRIGDMIPETMPYYAVEVYNGRYVGTAYISYDGRGERPTFPIYADETRTADTPFLFD